MERLLHSKTHEDTLRLQEQVKAYRNIASEEFLATVTKTLEEKTT